MVRWPKLAGFGMGLVGGACLLGLAGGGAKRPAPSGPILSECDGSLRELVIHYEPSAREIALPVYRQFLPALGPEVTVSVVCRAGPAYREFLSALGPVQCTLRPLVVAHPITTWSRDRWVALAPFRKHAPVTLLSPRGEVAEEIWPARAGDERVGADIAMASGGSVLARRSPLYFDGGDFLADSETVFVVPRLLQRNLQHTVATREEFLRLLALEFKKPVVLLDEAPDHHAGMFMASVGDRTILVGDPGLGRTLESGPLSGIGLPGGADISPETQRLFDAVAAQCQKLGYRVVRIPTLVAPDGRTYFTYVNAVIDQRDRRRLVYLPTYRGVEAMNLAARRVWENLGYEVRPVDCSSAYRHFGCLHCLVNITRRTSESEPASPAYTASSLTRNRTVR